MYKNINLKKSPFREKDAIKAAALAKDWDTLATLGSFTERWGQWCGHAGASGDIKE